VLALEGLCRAGAHCRGAQHAGVGERADERHARAVRVCEGWGQVRTTGASSRGYLNLGASALTTRPLRSVGVIHRCGASAPRGFPGWGAE